MLVDFWAEWCGPCKLLTPTIEELANEYKGKVVIGKLNVDEHSDIAATYGIRSIPSLLFFYLITYGQIELPKYSTDEIIIENTGYTVSFNETHLQPNWVAYELTKSEALGSLPRKNNFHVDPQIPDKTA